MIELIVRDRCTDCGECVRVCPTQVFEVSDGQVSIARAADCQTCFLCELYCRADALYVALSSEAHTPVTVEDVLAGGTLGEYLRNSGWHEHAGAHPNLFWLQGEIFARARSG